MRARLHLTASCFSADSIAIDGNVQLIDGDTNYAGSGATEEVNLLVVILQEYQTPAVIRQYRESCEVQLACPPWIDP
jgi:hypothetical protein